MLSRSRNGPFGFFDHGFFDASENGVLIYRRDIQEKGDE